MKFLPAVQLLLLLLPAPPPAASDLLAADSSTSSTGSTGSTGSSTQIRQERLQQLPKFSVSDLLTGRRLDELSDILTTTGILAVETATREAKQPSSSSSLQKLCDCSEKLTLSNVPNTDSIVLNDGSTKRTTLATATSGTIPLPLPDIQLDQVCGSGTAADLDYVRDVVAEASDAFVVALDQLLLLLSIGGGSDNHHQGHHLLKNKYGVSYPSVSTIRDKSNNLEHFHVYEKKKGRGGKQDNNNDDHSYSLDWHTDAGLFLSFLPARNCRSGGGDNNDEDKGVLSNAFWFMREDGKATQVQFSSSSPNDDDDDTEVVIIMLGAGAENWLNTPSHLPLKATKHAVKMHHEEKRAWYGMMHLVPDHALIEQGKTFADMREAMVLQKDRVYGQKHGNESIVSIGCGHQQDEAITTSFEEKGGDFVTKQSRHHQRRRLQHVQDARACNNATNFFCWMQCLDIPNHEDAENYVSEGFSLYCLDPAILASSGNQVSKAIEPCGLVHNSACMGSWQPTAPGVPSTEVEYNVTALPEEPFCYGGTSMYMDGFHWLDTTCVIYLFPSWVLTTPSKMVAAAFGSFAASIVLEKVIQLRRSAVTSMQPGYRRLGASGLSYGIQLTLGYFIMLAVMTYSGPIFMCLILGLVTGHVLFNAKDSPFASSRPKAQLVAQQESCCSGASPSDDGQSDSGVPEGSTPCCQNKL